MSDRRRTM